MNVSLSSLPAGVPVPIHFQVAWESLPPRAEGIRFAGPIEIQGDIRRIDDSIGQSDGGQNAIVEGVIRAELLSACDRCLTDVAVGLDLPFRAHFSACQAASTENDADPDSFAETEGMSEGKFGDVPLYHFDGERIDLTVMIQDEILINLPSRVLCKEKCKGLCPHCGCNQNETICSCRAHAESDTESRFAALRHLIIDDEEV